MIKIVVEALFTLLLGVLLVTAYLGLRTKKMRDTYTRDMIAHRRLAYIAGALYVLSIVATETMVRLHGGEEGSPYFPLHLFFAIVSFATFCLALRYNGNRKLEWHRYLVYTCIGSYVVAFAQALPLLKLF